MDDDELSPNQGLYGYYIKGKREHSSGGIQDYISTGSSLTLSIYGSVSATYPGFVATLTEFTGKL